MAWPRSRTCAAPSLRLRAPEGSGGFATLSGVGYRFGVETEGIERGMTGTFTVPAKILWSSWEIDPRSTRPSSGGRCPGTLSSGPGPDDTGSLSVDASIAYSRAGCYPGAGA